MSYPIFFPTKNFFTSNTNSQKKKKKEKNNLEKNVVIKKIDEYFRDRSILQVSPIIFVFIFTVCNELNAKYPEGLI